MEEAAPEIVVKPRSDSPDEYGNQHYVPVLYLKRFATPTTRRGKLFCFDLESKTCAETCPKKVAVQRNYNVLTPSWDTNPHGVEHEYSQLEDKVASTLDTIVRTKTLPPISSSSFTWLMLFMAAQKLRTPHARKQLEAVKRKTKWVVTEHSDMELESDSWKIAFAIGKTPWLSEILGLRVWKLYESPENEAPFICSDNPVAIMPTSEAKGHKGPIGLDSVVAIVAMPLTPHLMLVGRMPGTPMIETDGEGTVAKFNASIASTRFVYGSTNEFVYKEVTGAVRKWSDYAAGNAKRSISVNDESLIR